MLGRRDVSEVEPTSSEQPRNEGVRVPHVAGAQLVATPGRGRERWGQSQYLPGDGRIGRHSPGCSYGVRGVGDDSAGPAAHLVAEEAETTEPGQSHRTLTDDAAVDWATTPGGCELKHESLGAELHFQCGVEEPLRVAVVVSRGQRLEQSTVPAHARHCIPRAERKPEQVDARSSFMVCRQRQHILPAWPRSCDGHLACSANRSRAGGGRYQGPGQAGTCARRAGCLHGAALGGRDDRLQ